jgi:endonuclease YncB( thermonuclease family)
MRHGMMRHMSFPAFGHRWHGGVLAAAGAVFGVGFAIGAMVRPSLPPPRTVSVDTAVAAVSDTAPMPAAGSNGPTVDAPSVDAPSVDASRRDASRREAPPIYPTDVVRVIDGDTFEARVRVWPGLDVDTKVRLRNIDAPELHARCADELARAQAARAALQTMLAAGAVTISQVGIDKYGGRVDAVVATRDTADVSAALLNGGWARSYDGGRRGSWC